MSNDDFIERNKNRVDKQIKDFDDKFYNEYKTIDDVDEELQEGIIKYLNDNKSFAKKIVKMFTPKNEREITKKGKLYIKLAPYALVTALSLGMGAGIKIGKSTEKANSVTFSNEASVKYDNILDAPLEVKMAYVEDQIDKYNDLTIMQNKKYNPEFEDAYRRFNRDVNSYNNDMNTVERTTVSEPYKAEKTTVSEPYKIDTSDQDSDTVPLKVDDPKEIGLSIEESPSDFETIVDMNEINAAAEAVSDIARNDDFKETLPFESTPFAKSIVEDGNVYIPVEDGTEIRENDTLKIEEGTVFKRVK